MGFAGIGFGQAHMGKFWISVSHPGDDVGAVFDRQSEQCIADNEARVIARHMGELQTASHIASRIDATV